MKASGRGTERKKGRDIIGGSYHTFAPLDIISNSAHLYNQLLKFFRQYSKFKDLRHLKALAWMVSALIGSGQLSLPAWEHNVPCRAEKAQIVE